MSRNTRRRSTFALAAAAGCGLLLAGQAHAVGATVGTDHIQRQASSAVPGGRWTAAVPVPGLAALKVGHRTRP